jgi:hypothetical protein
MCVSLYLAASSSEVISPMRLDNSTMANPSLSEASVELPAAIEVSAWVIYDMTLCESNLELRQRFWSRELS